MFVFFRWVVQPPNSGRFSLNSPFSGIHQVEISLKQKLNVFSSGENRGCFFVRFGGHAAIYIPMTSNCLGKWQSILDCASHGGLAIYFGYIYIYCHF